MNQEKYENKLYSSTEKTYIGQYAPRGKIIDRNGNILVDNEEIYVINYNKPSNVTTKEEIDLAYELVELLDLEYPSLNENELKKIYYILYENEIKERINKDILEKYNSRTITETEYNNYLYKLISKDDLSTLSNLDLKCAYIYFLMNKGYKNDTKIIKENISIKESENILELSEYGFSIGINYKRIYPYGKVFRDYLGNLGKIPSEEVEYYLSQGYRRDDIVGISYLEKEYESYLKGTDEKYILTATGEKIIVQEIVPGNNIRLSIDINLQQNIENIIYNQIIQAKKEANTSYYNKSFVIVSNPKNGEILASAGIGVLNNNNYSKVDYLTDLTNYAVTPGSIVKGASHIVGYKYGAIDIGYTVTDSCIKVKNTPKKCSWKSLGKINDLTSLKYSSNYYQFLMAIKIGNGNYKYNQGLALNSSGFQKYREVYNEFGLGVKTGIDLPNETIGVVGKDTNSGSLIDYPIGQYETYTPMQLMQYINTLATSGKRYSLHYLLDVHEKNTNSILYLYEANVLNEVNIDSKYMERVREGLRMVMQSGGTGYSHINPKYNAAGKTGTAQSFIDTNADKKVDTETITSNFGAYIPYNDPNLSIVVISPNVSNRKTSFTSKVNRKIAKEVTNLILE